MGLYRYFLASNFSVTAPPSWCNTDSVKACW